MTRTSSPPKILVFDSGLGGLGILQSIHHQYSHCELVYCSDNKAFPYGIKTENELIARVSKVLCELNQAYSPDIFVIACNTASTVALPEVRSLIKSPVVGVVPAIKPAATVSRSAHIGLLATPGTINRQYTSDLITQFGSTFQWIKVGSSELVQIAEDKMYGRNVQQSGINRIVEPFLKFSTTELDTLVLACTHFPLLKSELMVALPHIKNWVDSTDAIANRVGFWLHELSIRENKSSSNHCENTIVFTQKNEKLKLPDSLLRDLDVKKISTLDV